jgi:hypothetical protein
MNSIKLPDGYFYLIRTVPMHRRLPRRMLPYAHVSDWIAQAGMTIAWGRTQREAIANLRSAVEQHQAGGVERRLTKTKCRRSRRGSPW